MPSGPIAGPPLSAFPSVMVVFHFTEPSAGLKAIKAPFKGVVVSLTDIYIVPSGPMEIAEAI